MARAETGSEPVVETLGPLGRDGGTRPEPGRAPVRREVAGGDRSDRRDRREPARDASRDRSPTTRRDARRDAQRLDLPRESRRLIRRPRFEDDTFGRFAEQFARFMGTASFLLYMTGFVIAWVLYNWLSPRGFDPFPFIFLTLMLSLQASYAAPLILLAQNRQEDRDRVVSERDRLANSRAHADMEFLAREMASLRMALGEVATRDYVRSELRSLLHELDDRAARADGPGEGREEGDSERSPREADRRLEP